MEQPYWFPAKRFGWGWGLPNCWQGWVVYIGFFGLIVAGTWILPPRESPLAYAGAVVVLSIALFVICWMKGEPPRWRWGGD